VLVLVKEGAVGAQVAAIKDIDHRPEEECVTDHPTVTVELVRHVVDSIEVIEMIALADMVVGAEVVAGVILMIVDHHETDKEIVEIVSVTVEDHQEEIVVDRLVIAHAVEIVWDVETVSVVNDVVLAVDQGVFNFD